MFNLTVETAHTFYVGENGWLVHNADGIVRVNSQPKIIGSEFDFAGRVVTQLANPRMGSTKLSLGDVERLVSNSDAQVIRDLKSNNISIIQKIDGKLIRITVAGDELKIISVGPIQPNQIKNSLKSGAYQLLREGC